MSKINLDKMISQCVHRPITTKDENRHPLYKRNDNAFDDKEGRTDAWKSAVEGTYASPNNIRRVFITVKGVYVDYYQPIKGVKDTSLRKFYKYSDFNFEETLKKMSNNESSDIKGYGFKAFKKWICTNLEELYFDRIVFISEDYNVDGQRSYYKEYIKRSKGLIQSDNPLKFFCIGTGIKPEDIRSSYPRLRYVGYCDRLDEVMSGDKSKYGRNSIEDMMSCWCFGSKMWQAAMNSDNTRTEISTVKQPFDIHHYTTRSFYSYDVEVLEPYFKDLKSRILRKEAEDRKASQAVNEAFRIRNNNKGIGLEELVEEVRKRYGNKAAEQTRRSLEGLYNQR